LYTSLSPDYALYGKQEYHVDITSELEVDYSNPIYITSRHDDGHADYTILFGSKTDGSNRPKARITAKALTITWNRNEQILDEEFLIRVMLAQDSISNTTVKPVPATSRNPDPVTTPTTTLKPVPATTRKSESDSGTTRKPTTTVNLASATTRKQDPAPATTQNPTTTVKLEPTKPTTIAVTSTTTVTSVENVDNYCNCGIVNGWFDHWNPKDIWVDVVILLDISASMGNSLEEAKSLIVSFVSLLSTDTTAEFYTRVGVITVADTVEVIYNLNMSSTDNLNMIHQHNINKIDIASGILAAQKMFARGMFVPSYRQNAKQIIYYLTNSAPGANMNGVNDFKTGGGIIIVNDYVIESQIATPGLKSIASDHFYFTHLKGNYIRSLSVICEANCFCNPNNHAFNDDRMSPRTQANRGCFHPVDNGIPFVNAAETCKRENSTLVSIHDEDKEYFVSSVVSIFGPRKRYWIAYHYNGTNWVWDDQSTAPFIDWDDNQPDTLGGTALCAYATQATGLNVRWRAANCIMGNLYVCESVPCRVGNQYC
ncbi:hypothetical protein PFISCL1PPCAC_18767, partial [Pristionchus fissidentatus]